MGRTHPVAAVIVDATGQNAGRTPEPNLASYRIGGELGLHCLEQVAVKDWLMLPGVSLAPIHDLADVESVLEEMPERADAEADAAPHTAIESGNRLGADAAALPADPVVVRANWTDAFDS
jgi:hypothetical protein